MYELNETVITIDGVEVVTYGITLGEYSVTAISTDRKFVEKLVCDFNEGKLDALQMNDVIEDVLGDADYF